MKILCIEIEHIGPLDDAIIDINKPLVLIFGQPRKGKTTILNAITWALGGKFPDDIIKHGEEEARIKLVTNSGYIQRTFYRDEKGRTKARQVEFVVDGKRISRPSEEIKMLINPFIIDRNYFENLKTDRERSDFLLDTLGVDVSTIDDAIKSAEKTARDLRIEIKAFGDIEFEEVEEPTPVDELIKEKNRLEEEYKNELGIVEAHNAAVHNINTQIEQLNDKNEYLDQQIKDLLDRIKKLQQEKTYNETKVKELQENLAPIVEPPPPPDTKAIDDKITLYQVQKLKYENYLKEKKRLEEKESKIEELRAMEEMIRNLRKQKQEELATISDECGVPGLGFNEEGDIVYENTALSMLSTSQKIDLQSSLRELFKNGLQIEMIDRAESLGTSIYDYIDKAKNNDLNILATIVGEAPAKTAEDVGVFVVDNNSVEQVR